MIVKKRTSQNLKYLLGMYFDLIQKFDIYKKIFSSLVLSNLVLSLVLPFYQIQKQMTEVIKITFSVRI